MLLSKHVSKRWILTFALLLLIGLAVRIYRPWVAPQSDVRANESVTSAVEVPVILSVFTAPAIQQDMNLTDSQIDELSILGETLEKQPYAVRDAAARKGVAAILDREQQKRYNQIMLRGLAVRAFGVTDVVETLGLTPEQQRKIAKIRANLESQLGPFRTAMEADGRPQDYSEAMNLENETGAIHANAYQKALGVLTSAQRKAFDEMIGSTVDPQ